MPQSTFEKVVEEITPLLDRYTKATENIKQLNDASWTLRKDFLSLGIEYTKVSDNQNEDIEEKILAAYKSYKNLLEERSKTCKDLLSHVNILLSSVDQQLLLLDSQYDPKFGIQTQNSRIFKTNKSYADKANEARKDEIHCICGRPPYGDMIACDGYHMESPWYHMDCVGYTGIPRGHWLCPKCRTNE